MKRSGLFFAVFFWVIAFSSAQDFRKVAEENADPADTRLAEKFATDYMNKLKGGSWYQFSDEATNALKTGLTETTQKSVHQQLKGMFGEFVSMKYAETWTTASGDQKFDILRFKGIFDKTENPLEIRVVLNDQDKIAGFFIKPWTEGLN